MATPPPEDDRRRTIRLCDPLTYDQDHTRAGARALRPKRGNRSRFSCVFVPTVLDHDHV
jgi:hypothetical protein